MFKKRQSYRRGFERIGGEGEARTHRIIGLGFKPLKTKTFDEKIFLYISKNTF
jgi:hypothetical protein